MDADDHVLCRWLVRHAALACVVGVLMRDIREEILVHLVALMATVPGITAVYRNRGELPKEKLPGAVVLDGSEDLRSNIGGKSFVQMPPAVFTIKPYIYIVLQMRDDITNETVDGVSHPVGPAISAFRMFTLNAVLNDPTLIALCGPNGQIEYRGCETDMQPGAPIGSLGGQIQMKFTISYTLNPSDLS